MSEDILKTAEKYLFPKRLTPADMEDAPRVIRALAGKFHGQRVHGVEVLEEGAICCAVCLTPIVWTIGSSPRPS